MRPVRRLKLMSVLIGPFPAKPSGLKLKLELRDYVHADLFKESEKIANSKAFWNNLKEDHEKHENFEQKFLFNKLNGSFYVLLTINPNIIFQEDICVMLSTKNNADNSKVPTMKFRFWLNATMLA
jgi:hypothetical protein